MDAARAMPPTRRRRSRRALLALVLASAAGLASSATYVVDPVAGLDDPGHDGSDALPWRTLTHALDRADDGGEHLVVLRPGTYAASSGERFPLRLPPRVSLLGTDPATTRIVDVAELRRPTVQWRLAGVTATPGTPSIEGLTIERVPRVQPVGTALHLVVEDATASPRLTNLTIRGAALGLELEAAADLAPARMAPSIERCRIVGNGVGVLASAYTSTGAAAGMDPAITSTIVAGSLSDGVVVETGADWDLGASQRQNATSQPVLTHATIAGNLGSGILLDNSNLYIRYRSGPIQPAVTNCVLAGNGDYGLHEYTSTTDPVAFRRNVLGGNGLGLYRDEGAFDRLAVGDVPGSGHLDGVPTFVAGLDEDVGHLRPDSVGVDVADPALDASDVDGDARPLDGDGDGTAVEDIGADEAWPCAVRAVLVPADPPPGCGAGTTLLLDASASSSEAAWPCPGALAIEWHADGVPVGSGPTLEVAPDRTTTYLAVVRCPDRPHCVDAASVTVAVLPPPVADASAGSGGAPYEACVDWDAPDVTVPLAGTAAPGDPSAPLTSTEWSSAGGSLVGGSSLAPLLVVPNTGENQGLEATLTVTDANGCATSSTAQVRVWRAPRVLAGGPYRACQPVGATSTSIPLRGDALLPAGSAVTAWSWTTTAGTLTGADGPAPRLVFDGNLPVTRTATVTATAVDDHGCAASGSASVTLDPTPRALVGGPFQQQETGGGTTTFALAGASTGAPVATWSWSTTLGTFRSTGGPVADGLNQVLDIAETGGNQTGDLCLVVTGTAGCPHEDCTTVSVRTTAPLPPADVGPTLAIAKGAGAARLAWSNSPVVPGVADVATSYEVWQSTTRPPAAGTWSLRTPSVPWRSGVSDVVDAALLDVAGPDLVFLQIVSVNVAGSSCAEPATSLPDCD